jgi:plastocyanin
MSALAQAIHEVQVLDLSYEPANITVQAGDTVRWIDSPPTLFHNVIAEDFSWGLTSIPRHGFTFDHTFTQAGTYPYFCQHHADNDQRGTVIVQGSVEPPFELNAGLNDSWLNPATSGQGFFISVFPDISSIFMAWFTYDTDRPEDGVTANLGEPGHRWLTAFGDFTGNAAVLDVELTQGGVFNAAEPEVEQSSDGSILLECTGCNACTVTYDIASAGRQGVIPIERIATDNVPACEALAGNE